MPPGAKFSIDDVRVQLAVAQRTECLLESIVRSRSAADKRIVKSLGRRGARTEIDVLAGLLNSPNVDVRTRAAELIDAQAQGFAREATPGWTTWWSAPETENILVAGLADASAHVRRHLLCAFPVLRFGQLPVVLPILLDRLRDHEHPELRQAALAALPAVGVDRLADPSVLNQIASLAGDGSPEVRSQVYALLTLLGPDAVSALPALVKRATSCDESPELRVQIAHALLAIDPRGDALALISEPDRREAILGASRALGAAGRKFRRRLVARWQSPETPLSPDCHWLNKRQIARQLMRDEKTVARWLKSGKLVVVKTREVGPNQGRTEYLIENREIERLKKP